ncbi:MAG: class I SAM-dependent methyltransferase [Anaerolineales bacterium]|nr:class I SAM-dependent methyltransferase [Anaerolineales bacterium]
MQPVAPEKLYDPAYIKQLFNEMSGTYGLVNLISSFGFAWWWRGQCVRLARLNEGGKVCDFMSGQGEAWPDILRWIGPGGQLYAFDISNRMVELSTQTAAFKRSNHLHVSNQNALVISFTNASMDAVISTFGLKTFSEPQLHTLAREIMRLLKPGGTFALVEISVPASAILRIPYMIYIQYCIPLLGRVLLGNPDNYRLLARYTRLFKNAKRAQAIFRIAGLETQYTEFFFGCASAVYGHKPPTA